MTVHKAFWLIIVAVGLVLVVWADPIDKPSKMVNFLGSAIRSVLGLVLFILGLYNILN